MLASVSRQAVTSITLPYLCGVRALNYQRHVDKCTGGCWAGRTTLLISICPTTQHEVHAMHGVVSSVPAPRGNMLLQHPFHAPRASCLGRPRGLGSRSCGRAAPLPWAWACPPAGTAGSLGSAGCACAPCQRCQAGARGPPATRMRAGWRLGAAAQQRRRVQQQRPPQRRRRGRPAAPPAAAAAASARRARLNRGGRCSGRSGPARCPTACSRPQGSRTRSSSTGEEG